MKIKHLTIEKARQEITVFNALVRVGVIESNKDEPIEVSIEKGVKKLLES